MARIIIIEQDEAMCELLQIAVTRLGHEPVLPALLAGTLPEATVALVEPAAPGALQAALALRRARPALEFVVISTRPASQASRELRPLAHVVKPCSFQTLLSTIEAAVDRTPALPA